MEHRLSDITIVDPAASLAFALLQAPIDSSHEANLQLQRPVMSNEVSHEMQLEWAELEKELDWTWMKDVDWSAYETADAR